MMIEGLDPLRHVRVADLVKSSRKTASAYAAEVAQSLTLLGIRAGTADHGDWISLSLAVGTNLVEVGIIDPEEPHLNGTALPVRFALDLEYGLPSGLPFSRPPEVYFSLPVDCSLTEFLRLCQGQWSPLEFAEVLNFSARHALSAPRKLPSSILIMISERTKKTESGDRWFELWTQSGSEVSTHILTRTNNPHLAAQEAAELGFGRPTVYRCHSGRFIAFTTTPGGAFF